MPEDFCGKWFKRIKPQWKTAFISAAVFGFLTHMYIFTNSWPHHDGIISIYTPQQGFEMGRFFLTPFSGIGSYFDLPWINGILSVFYLALTAVVLTELFGLKKKLSIVLVSGLFATFPVVSATMSYMFTVDGYMLATLVTLLSLLVTRNYKYGFLPGALLLYMGVGVYQANFPLLLTVATVFLINEIMSHKISLRNFLLYIVRFGLLAFLGMALYYLTFKIYTNLFSGQLNDYQGMDAVGGSGTELLQTFPLIRDGMIEFFFRGFFSGGPVSLFEVLNVVLFILIGLAIAAAVVEKKVYQRRGMLVIAVILTLSLPLSAYSLYFISPDIWYHFLMILSVISFYLLPVVIYDSLEIPSGWTKSASWGVAILMPLIIFNFAVIANISYLNMNLKFEKSQALALRIVDRVEQTEGFDPDIPIAIYGRVPTDSEVSTIIRQKIPPMTGSLQKILLRDPRHFEAMLENYLGVSYNFIEDEEELREISRSEVYEEMDAWPAATSVQLNDGVLIIKLE